MAAPLPRYTHSPSFSDNRRPVFETGAKREMRVEGLLDQLVAAPDLFDFDGADLGSTKAQLQFPVRRAPETDRTDDLAVAFVHALRKGQEQGQQAYLFPDALIKLEEQRDFLGGPLTVEERQRRYELDFAFRETEQFRIADQIVAVRVVVRKGNEDPDVVQQGGIVQQLARYGRGVVQPDGPRAVEQFEGQLRDVPGCFSSKRQNRASWRTLSSRAERREPAFCGCVRMR